MSSQSGIAQDDLLVALQREKQAIFNMHASEAEKSRVWSQRRAELVESFLAADCTAPSARHTTTFGLSMERAASHVGSLSLATLELDRLSIALT